MHKIIVMIFMCLIAIGAVACKSESSNENESGINKVYLANADMNGLVSINVDLKADTTDDKIEKILELLKQGNDDGKASIPAMVNVVSIKIEDKNAILSFDETYSKITSVEEIICRSSIVKSITDLTEIDSVEFYIGSVPYQNSNGTVLGAMGPDDVVLDFSLENNEEKTQKVMLYFADQQGEFLVPVEYEISLNSEQQIEKTILNLLINGPTDETLIATIPKETEVKNVYTNEGVCYVDLNEEFITKHMGGSTGEMLTIYSIVNTLTELDNINKVQFLIEGTKRSEFKGHLEFDVLFQRNFDILEK